MKALAYISISIIFWIGCADNGPAYLDELELRPAYSEFEFKNREDLFAIPGSVLVGQLENTTSVKADSLDSDFNGQKGFDFFRISVPRTDNFSFKIESTENIRFSIHRYPDKSEIFFLDQSKKESSINLAEGKYFFVIENLDKGASTTKNTIPYFIQPDREKFGLLDEKNPPQTDLYKVTDKAYLISTTKCRYQNMQKLYMKSYYLKGVDFTGSKLRLSNFSYAILDNANLSKTNLYFTNLSNSQIKNALIDSVSDFSSADFTKANLSNTQIRYGYSRNAVFFNAVLSNTNFENTILSNANMFAVNASSSTITRTDLSESELSFSILSSSIAKGANFCNSNTLNWFVDGVVTDSTTKCFVLPK